jgi:hypothetical protein
MGLRGAHRPQSRGLKTTLTSKGKAQADDLTALVASLAALLEAEGIDASRVQSVVSEVIASKAKGMKAAQFTLLLRQWGARYITRV